MNKAEIIMCLLSGLLGGLAIKFCLDGEDKLAHWYIFWMFVGLALVGFSIFNHLNVLI